MPYISTLYARLIGREISHNQDVWPQLLEGIAIPAEDIRTQPQMNLDDFNRLLQNALTISGDPALGLRFGQHAQMFSAADGGFAALCAPNLLEMLRAYNDFSRLQAEYLSMDLKVDLNALKFRARETASLFSTRRTQHEVMVLSLQNGIELILGRPFTEGKYFFSFKEPEYSDRYNDVFHSRCHFNAPETGVDIPRSLLGSRSPFFNQPLWEQGRDRALALMQELNNRDTRLHSHHVLSFLRSQPPPLPSATQTASRLGLSERSLIRRLSEEGIRYRQLQHEVLLEWAHHYLIQTHNSVESIAAQLGYQDAANFRRAFKRLQGCTPQEYRFEHRD